MEKKIRFWNKEENKYLCNNKNDLIKNEKDIFILGTDNLIPEYSTGLVDFYKNEVFEGDIVQDVEDEDYGIIIFENGHFYINIIGVCEDIEDIWSFNVVGNIHDKEWREVVKSIGNFEEFKDSE